MDIIQRLEAARDRTLAYFDLNDDQLARSYAPGKWSVRFLLHHLADSETVLYDRIGRVISEPGCVGRGVGLLANTARCVAADLRGCPRRHHPSGPDALRDWRSPRVCPQRN